MESGEPDPEDPDPDREEPEPEVSGSVVVSGRTPPSEDPDADELPLRRLSPKESRPAPSPLSGDRPDPDPELVP